MILNGASAQTVERFISYQAEAARLAEAWDKLRDFRDYYAGTHPVFLTERQKEFLGPILTDADSYAFAFNLCKVVIDTLGERLKLEGFTGQDAAGEALAEKIADWWERGGCDAKEDKAHMHALRDTHSYNVVRWVKGENFPTYEPELAFDGNTGVTVHKNIDNEIDLAVRYWRVDDITSDKHLQWRRNIYMDGKIIHQKEDAGGPYGWGPIDADEGPAVEYWTDNLTATGRSMGIPVIELENADEQSEIQQLIGPQNGLNKFVLDLLAAGDTTGFQMLALQYREGVFPEAMPADSTEDTHETDDATKQALRMGPGRAIELWDGTTIQAIPAGDLGQLIESIRFVVNLISGVSRTPQYYLMPIGGSDVPSGEALKQLESGLVSRANKRTTIFGGAWVKTARQMARLYRAMGNTDVDAEAPLKANWASTEIRYELYNAQVAEAEQRLGVPQEALWELRLGYGPDDVKRFKQLAAKEQQRRLSMVLGGLNGSVTEEVGGNGSGGAANSRGGANGGASLRQ
jgi:hypothetical protein